MREADVSVLAVGFFDGVHLGHQAILRGADAALTFRSHPLSVLAPDRAPPLMMDLDERVAAIRACGVRDVVALEFTPELAALSPEEFIGKAKGLCRFSSVRCGADWRFGRGGEGNAEWLRAHGTPVEVAPYAEWRGGRISSSRIRAALSRGEVEDAVAMTGRALRVAGRRFHGKGMGGSLGFPTVNLASDAPVLRLLPRGVYQVEVNGALGVANYGVAPTMGDRAWESPVMEIHFPDGAPMQPEGDGASLQVSFVRFVRPERRFASLADLKAQIAADCAAVTPRSRPSGLPSAGGYALDSSAGVLL